MANAIETFDLTVASQFAIKMLQPQLAMLSGFTTDVSTGHVSAGELRKGKTVHVRSFTTPATTGAGVGDFNKSTNNYEDAQDLDINTVAVALDQHKKVTFSMDDAEQELWVDGIPRQLLSDYAYTLGRIITTDVQSILTTANYSSETIVLATALDFDEVANQRKLMVDAGADMNNLTMVLDSAYYLNLLQDDTTQTLISRQTDSLLREANIGRLHGVNIVGDAEINDVSENLAGWISDKSAVAVANAILVPSRGDQGAANEVIEWETATDPVSGFTIGMRKHYASATGDYYVTMEAVYGKAVATDRASALSRLVTAA